MGNGRYAGGGFDVCPEARPDNGLMEVTMAAAGPEGARVTRPLWEWLAGDSNDGEHVRQARTSRLVVSSEMSVQFNLDGEPVRGQRFIFEVIPDALAFVLPAAGTRPA
ncbi:MAG: hypothetical protein CMH57_03450 [Myxococcales bacterium]|nr:hypothetical protein [Myxococcales bacterium]